MHAARALMLADLAANEVAAADVVSMVAYSVAQRRWWVERWPDGAEFVAGPVPQDVRDTLLEACGRRPLCRSGDLHALEVEPDLGAAPHWGPPQGRHEGRRRGIPELRGRRDALLVTVYMDPPTWPGHGRA